MNRKQRRAQEAQIRKDGNEELATKVAMLGQLPEECTACTAAYDKNDKEMATTWSVVVHGEEEIVRLYCPDCWSMAEGIAKDFADHLEEKYGGGEE